MRHRRLTSLAAPWGVSYVSDCVEGFLATAPSLCRSDYGFDHFLEAVEILVDSTPHPMAHGIGFAFQAAGSYSSW